MIGGKAHGDHYSKELSNLIRNVKEHTTVDDAAVSLLIATRHLNLHGVPAGAIVLPFIRVRQLKAQAQDELDGAFWPKKYIIHNERYGWRKSLSANRNINPEFSFHTRVNVRVKKGQRETLAMESAGQLDKLKMILEHFPTLMFDQPWASIYGQYLVGTFQNLSAQLSLSEFDFLNVLMFPAVNVFKKRISIEHPELVASPEFQKKYDAAVDVYSGCFTIDQGFKRFLDKFGVPAIKEACSKGLAPFNRPKLDQPDSSSEEDDCN